MVARMVTVENHNGNGICVSVCMSSLDVLSGFKWNLETLEYFCIKLNNVTEFNDFVRVMADDIALNEDTQEFLLLDLGKMFYNKVIDFRTIKSDMVESLIKAAFIFTQTSEMNEAAVNILTRELVRLFKYSKLGLLIQDQVILELEMSKVSTKVISDICIATEIGYKSL